MRLLCTFLFLSLFTLACNLSGTFTGALSEKVNIQLSSVDELYQLMTHSEQRVPLVSAHRGGPGPGFPENALETFENTARNQPVIIECDISISKDSVLVLMHDEKVDRTTNGEGLVRMLTYKQLEELYLVDELDEVTSFKIPTLDEVLRWGAKKVVFTLDIKKGVPVEMVIDAIRRNKAEAYSIIISKSVREAAKIYDIAPDLMISASIRKPDDLLRLNDSGVPDNRLIAFVGGSEAQPETYKLLHEHGILCILGTMGNLDKQAETKGDVLYFDLIDRGADILSTDRPVEAGIQLHKYRTDNGLVSEFIK